MATNDNRTAAQRAAAALVLNQQAMPPLGEVSAAPVQGNTRPPVKRTLPLAPAVPNESIEWAQARLAADAESPANNILAGARNAPLVKVAPADWVGVPDTVRMQFEASNGGGGRQGMFFPKETPARKAERERLEAEGAYGFYAPSQDEVYIAPGLTPAEERFAAYHEVAGHYGLQGAMGDDYAAIMGRAIENPTVAQLAQAMRGASTDYASVEGMDAAEEALAELAAAQRTGDYDVIEREWGVRVPTGARSGFKGMLTRMVQLTKRKLADLTGEEPEAFDDEQVHQLISDAWRYVKRKPQSVDDAAAAAMSAGIKAASQGRE